MEISVIDIFNLVSYPLRVPSKNSTITSKINIHDNFVQVDDDGEWGFKKQKCLWTSCGVWGMNPWFSFYAVNLPLHFNGLY